MIAKLIYCQDSASKLTSHIKTNVRSNADNIRKNSFNFSEDQNFLTTTKLYCARVNNASIHIQKFKTRLTNQMPLTAQFFFSSTSYWFCLLILLDKWMTFSRCSLCFSDKCQGFKACFKHCMGTRIPAGRNRLYQLVFPSQSVLPFPTLTDLLQGDLKYHWLIHFEQ